MAKEQSKYELFPHSFFFVYCGAKFVLRKALTFGANRVTIQTTKNTSNAAEAAFEVFCLTTVYPIYTTGVHGISGDKTAGKHLFPSGKGRKCLEISGKRYSGILWDHEAQSSKLCTPTKKSTLRRAFFNRINYADYYCSTNSFSNSGRLPISETIIIKAFRNHLRR